MNIADFSELFRTFKRTAFRLETLQKYAVEFEAAAFRAFLDGEPLPSDPNKEWVEIVSKNHQAGKEMSRVHIVRRPLSPYVKFEIEWAYLYSARAGENIRLGFVDDAELVAFGDFWIFDDTTVVRMHYGPEGNFVRPELATQEIAEACIGLRARAIDASIPLKSFLAEQRRT